jgi:tRNA-specific 2-thiouridylase
MKTVYVGLSGGVDSSVTAALLKQQGYGVVGVYMKNWTTSFAGLDCPWQRDLADAKSVAASLGIEFKVFDFEQQYKQKVVETMLSDFASGLTPNPDVMCNQEIKFKLFLETALADGADLIATGHYARIQNNALYAGLDPTKDQSYFLYRVTASALAQSLMPLGEMTKASVRALARQLGLGTATKKDSVGICFVGEVGMKDFLGQYLDLHPGEVRLRSTGAVLGEHPGAVLYTLGQRHGLGIGGGKPYYVVSKDLKTNTVWVTDHPGDLSLYTDEFNLEQLHWIEQVPQPGQSVQVRTRYRGPLVDGQINAGAVKLVRPMRAVTPGQSAVVYQGDKVLGGGIIQPQPELAIQA